MVPSRSLNCKWGAKGTWDPQKEARCHLKASKETACSWISTAEGTLHLTHTTRNMLHPPHKEDVPLVITQPHLQKTAYVVIDRNTTDWDLIQGPNSPSSQHSCLLCLHWYLSWISRSHLATSLNSQSSSCPAQTWELSCLHVSVLPSTASVGFGTCPCLAGSHHKCDLQHPSHSIFYYLQEVLYAFCWSLSKRSPETQVLCRPAPARFLCYV